MKIAMLLSRFYPVQGGTEIQCRLLSNELIRKGHEVFVLTQKLPGLKASEKLGELPVYRIGLPIQGKTGSFFYVFYGIFWLLSNRDKFDVLHVHLASSQAVLGAIIGKITKKPVILKIAGSRKTGDVATSSRTWYGRMKLVFLMKSINSFICPSMEIRKELVLKGFSENKIDIICNGVETGTFAPSDEKEKQKLRQKLGFSADSRIVIYTGRLEPGKGLQELIDVWKRIEKKLADTPLRLIIAGSGLLFEELKQNSFTVKSIDFLGWKEKVSDYIRASDIFVLPSHGEGMPNALLEAMSCGLACLATNIGGINELIVNGKTGILFKDYNKDEFLSQLEKLILDKELCLNLGKSASAHISKNLSIEQIAHIYLALYKNMIPNN